LLIIKCYLDKKEKEKSGFKKMKESTQEVFFKKAYYNEKWEKKESRGGLINVSGGSFFVGVWV
jgi:hypothetical protein